MRNTSTGHQSDAGRYEIRVEGRLEARWAAWFDGMALRSDSDGTTTIHGPVLDQAALHGLLRKLHDVGLPLISVTQLQPDQPQTSSLVSPEGH